MGGSRSSNDCCITVIHGKIMTEAEERLIYAIIIQAMRDAKFWATKHEARTWLMDTGVEWAQIMGLECNHATMARAIKSKRKAKEMQR